MSRNIRKQEDGPLNLYNIVTYCPSVVLVGKRLWVGGAGDHYALEAWERMTSAGLKVDIQPAQEHSPWGTFRFRELLPLNVMAWDDKDNGKWY